MLSKKKTFSNLEELFNIKDKVIFVTGGTGVLGWTYCNALSQLGAKIVLTDLGNTNPEKAALELKDTYGSETLGITCDITNENDVVSSFSKTLEFFGRVDVVINNAAATGEHLMDHGDVFSDFEEYPLNVWEEVLKINLTGPFLIAREGGKAMKLSGSGSMINVSSIYGFIGPDHRIYEGMPFKSFPGYSATKAGVHGLSRWLATYWGHSGIRVNTVVPGGVFNGHNSKFVKKYSEKTPLGRMANREDLIGVIVFLASDASSYCTGQKFIVDGGFTSW